VLNKLPLEESATLLIVTGFLIATFDVPGNTTSRPSYPADSDGDVPVKKACYDKMPKNAWTDRKFSENKMKVEATIYVDTCELDDLEAGPQDIKNFIKHEKSHAEGWQHGEGNPETNAAYYPTVDITGR
jgi:hypothetical protein